MKPKDFLTSDVRMACWSKWALAKACKDAALFPGAAPITLIDGDKLIELLLKHGVGVKKKPQTLIEVDESYFDSVDPEKQLEAEE